MKIKTILKILIIICFLLIGYQFIQTSYYLITEKYALNQVEGSMVLFLDRLIQGNSLYPPTNMPPYFTNTYAPFFYLFLGTLSYLIPYFSSLQGLRLFTIFVEIIIVFLTYKLIFLETKSRKISLISSFMFLALLSTHKFHGLARIDMFLVLLATSGIYFVRKYFYSKNQKWLVAFCIIFVLAIYTKLTAIFTLFTILIYSIYKKQKGTFTYSILCITLSIILYFITNTLTKNGFFNQTIYYQSLSNINFYMGFSYLFELLKNYWFLVIASMLALKSKQLPIFYKFLITTEFFWFTFTIFKGGADLNYSILLFVLTTVTFSIYINNYLPSNDQGDLILLLILIFVVMNMFNLGYYYRYFLNQKVINERDKMATLVKEIPDKMIFIEDPYFAIVGNKEILASDPYQLGMIIKNGVKINNFYENLDNGTVNYVITSNLIKLFPNLKLKERGFKKIYISKTWITHGYWEVWKKE